MKVTNGRGEEVRKERGEGGEDGREIVDRRKAQRKEGKWTKEREMKGDES